MKCLFAALFVTLSSSLFAQINTGKIYGTWVKCKASYRDGAELPDDHVMKYTYFKYSFIRPDKLMASVSYFEQGTEMLFEIKNNELVLKSPEGGVVNSFHIESLKDTLVLLQGSDAADDSNMVKLFFVPENVYQNSLQLKSEDIYAIKTTDTVYKQSAKIYAHFNDNSFQKYIYAGLRDKVNMGGRVGYFNAGFIVSKLGIADSLKIYEGIDEDFKKQFIKVFAKAKNKWKPAMLNDKPVAVYTTVSLGYSTSETMLPAYLSGQKANEAYNNKDYDLAIYYFDKALKSVPTDKENLYKRGMCKLNMGNPSGACEDWKAARALGSSGAVDAMLAKYNK
jgi:tetratricopeptide (TPR) repeat protein